MKAYNEGVRRAFADYGVEKVAEEQPTLGEAALGLGGGLGGAYGGTLLGQQLGAALGKHTRTYGIPGTGVGEKFLGLGMSGENIGGMLGGAAGGLGGYYEGTKLPSQIRALADKGYLPATWGSKQPTAPAPAPTPVEEPSAGEIVGQ